MATLIQRIRYRGGYKYQLADDYTVMLPFAPPVPKEIVAGGPNNPYITFLSSGQLTILAGYAWDGPSGPTVDGKTNMRASIIHDAAYQLIRLKFLPEEYRKKADEAFRDLCIEDGMSRLRAQVDYWGLRAFGKKAATGPEREVMTAP